MRGFVKPERTSDQRADVHTTLDRPTKGSFPRGGPSSLFPSVWKCP